MNKVENRPVVNLLGVRIHAIPLASLLLLIQNTLQTRKRLLIGNVNIHALNLAYENPLFRKTLNIFDVVFCDGFGVMLGARLAGQHIQERYTPPDFIYKLLNILCEQDGKIFLLGGAPGVAERAAETLQKSIPNLKIVGTHYGFFEKSKICLQNNEVLEKINASKPELLLVAFGMPIQEEWLVENWKSLNVNIALSVGALFDTLSGNIPRAPRWLTDHGFEWLARLIIEPRRLWRRYIIGIPLFFLRLIQHHWLNSMEPF